MFDKSDPRAALFKAPANAPVFTAYSPADYVRFYETEPAESGPDGRTWLMRGQNGVVAYSEAKSGARFSRQNQPDEWVLLLPDAGVSVRLTAGGDTRTIEGYSVTFVPPGDSAVEVLEGGRIVRLFTTRNADLAERCSNAAEYAQPHHNIPPFQPWPTPPDGFKIRTYSLDVPDEPGRFGRIWRCTTFMVNYLAPQVGPRDTTKLSPHHHDDFEQYSLAVQGAFIHHLRWPWTPDMRMWRQDEHEYAGTPSVTVIPPPAIHTTRGMDPGVNQLVDIFSPPRMDFSLKPGWVLNTDDYPLPG
ncbi:hypothetical protein GCM10007036_10760 [Alsobacter metallidurans]|uniref:Uncharacterized protein n=1 Tax=Alsobacter metallidurans TaxID=340221 RepID=A0A917I5T3_9HYPH|nr:hypothetical protein [Alsobacter metallidurans]GGH12699.1 hypothetical protein GCM10007036_10760 [Alsobacter metallidurans]